MIHLSWLPYVVTSTPPLDVVDDVNVTSVHQLWTRLTTTSESLYVSLHFQENLVGDLYQVTLHNTGSIADWSRCGIKCRRVFDMVFVTESKGYGQHCGISRGSYIVAVNGLRTRVPFMGFEALTEFIAGSPHYRLPLTLDLLDSSNQDAVIIETERLLMTASLSVFHMAKATEQLRQLFLTVHEAMLVPLGLADVVDTCGKSIVRLASIGLLAEFIQRIHKKMLTRGHDHHDRRRVMLVDMEDLRWRHQMLEAGIMFAEVT
ncbi:hypothetical protein DYB32_009463 [Aphanomyces invadans]|uniref:Uncharacterized protein n=1 Tax=Aphanomyces invadans TaxID=157072 RepID=A0A418AP55_9STRA|nr:hypothetical protein DYB32_009463 [Aphanomyces invadans]